MDLRTIARALGGDVCGQQVLAPGPRHSPKDRSLSVTFGRNGQIVTHSFAGDSWKDCHDHVRARLGLPHQSFEALTVVDSANENSRLKRTQAAMRIWREALPLNNTIAEYYLNSRALELWPSHGNVVRFHPHCPWEGTRLPAMVTLFRCIFTDVPKAIQRTALTQDGQKIGRKMLGPVRHTAIKIDQATDELVIGEGFESCLSARQMRIKPVWALGSVGAIAAFPLIDGVGELAVLAETGAASANAIDHFARRWKDSAKVFIFRPAHGSDMNDALQMRGARNG